MITMTLPRPGGTVSVVLAGGVSQATLHLPVRVPARPAAGRARRLAADRVREP